MTAVIVGAIDQEAVYALICRRADLTPRFPQPLRGALFRIWVWALSGGNAFRALFALPMNESGLVVIECANADEALEVLHSRAAVSTLFADFPMPGSMDGLQLAIAVHCEFPS